LLPAASDSWSMDVATTPPSAPLPAGAAAGTTSPPALSSRLCLFGCAWTITIPVSITRDEGSGREGEGSGAGGGWGREAAAPAPTGSNSADTTGPPPFGGAVDGAEPTGGAAAAVVVDAGAAVTAGETDGARATGAREAWLDVSAELGGASAPLPAAAAAAAPLTAAVAASSVLSLSLSLSSEPSVWTSHALYSASSRAYLALSCPTKKKRRVQHTTTPHGNDGQ